MFSLPPAVYGPFTLLADHKDITGIYIELNGTTLVGTASFGPQPLRTVVNLNAENTLQVGLGVKEVRSP